MPSGFIDKARITVRSGAGGGGAAPQAPERRLQIFFEELLNGGAVGLLIAALHRDSDGLTGLDAHAHEGHELGGRGGLAAVSLGNSDGAVQALGGFGQQAGGAGVDAYRVGDGVLKLFHPVDIAAQL